MRCPKQTGELYSTRCHSVKWLPAYDHLKYPDSEPYAGLAFRCMSILFTSMMLFATRRVFSISTNAICAYGSVGKTGPRKLIFHKRMFLIVIVIEHLETGGDRVEVIV